ncbi:hypothetical protein E2C01_039675 [Portunus trituberculatus]|uniref:Uncharacterized protein n=1 Tax=Portunus trituberculatus TaxID=210409 RepID=A0A5B7FLC9_PORTR|nr:hypothetical protein [Portunus trituberculatus]
MKQANSSSQCLTLVTGTWQPFSIVQNDAPPYHVTGSAKDVVDILAKQLELGTSVPRSAPPLVCTCGPPDEVRRSEVRNASFLYSANF